MSLEIFLTDEAKEMLYTVSTFIEDKFGKTTKEKFLNTAYKTFDTISKQPYIFKVSDFGQDVRIGLINKNCSFYYQIQDDKIYILFLWDNRQESNINP